MRVAEGPNYYSPWKSVTGAFPQKSESCRLKEKKKNDDRSSRNVRYTWEDIGIGNSTEFLDCCEEMNF